MLEQMETEELKPRLTLHDYINQLLQHTGNLMALCRDSAVYEDVDHITLQMDKILIEMRHIVQYY